MKKYVILSFALLSVLSACQQDELADKKAELSEKKKQFQALKTDIESLEKEIAQLDTAFAEEIRRSTLVTALPVKQTDFAHYVEVRSEVQSDRNVTLSAESMGAVQRILVSEGQQVKAGQLLMSIDAEVLKRNIAEVKTQLELAETLYEKQKRLWDQKIGTEVQYLQAKSNKESLENRLATLQAQLAQTNLTAPFSGNVEQVMVRTGEIAAMGMPLLRLVSLSDMYLRADVSEAYIGKFSKGDKVEVYFPSLDTTLVSELSAVGQVINPSNRTFAIEAKLPAKSQQMLRPNLLAVMKVKDAEREDALLVPTNLIQRDGQGEFVYVIDASNDIPKAEKKHIETGMSYNNETVVLEGLTASDVLVNEGYREVTEGMNLKLAEKELAKN
jgi:membrane fusion protein (multidrug efflux system)